MEERSVIEKNEKLLKKKAELQKKGSEVMDEALKVLKKIGRKYDCEFACTKLQAGGCAILVKMEYTSCKSCTNINFFKYL